MPRAYRVPLFRIGLTLIVGSMLASLIFFYVSVGQTMADPQGETMSTQPRDLLHHFTTKFLFAGGIPGILFYAGLAFMVVGIIRNLATPRAAR